jgi:ATP-dependent RNA helicase DeaD
VKTPADPTPTTPLPGFETFGLRPELLQTLAQLGYEEPTPVQRAAIPPLLEGRDVVAQAATGTGKTAAFAIPLLQQLTPGALGPFQISSLVLVPTRELAMQVAEAIFKYGKIMGASVLPVYGGQEMGPQLQRLKRGVDIVVATPGRALDHLRRKSLLLDKVARVVLDEADEMLDMGFAEDLETILSALPPERQTALFSATLPARIASIAERHLRQPVRLKLAKEKPAAGEAPKVRQTVYLVPRGAKDDALGRILDLEAPVRTIVFCRTRNEVDALSETLQGHGLRAAALHGGMSQEQRDRVMRRFKSKEVELLVATDVAARGLDIDHLSHVVNYDLPTSPEVYVHRIGRTGRAGREGVAITLAEPREARLLTTIERTTGQKIGRANLPTDNDVRTRRLELTRAAVKSALEQGGLDDYRSLAASLMGEFPTADVAAAALKLLHEASAPPPRAASAESTPSFGREPRGARPERSGKTFGGRMDRTEKFGSRSETPRSRPERAEALERPARTAPVSAPEEAPREERPARVERTEPRPPAERAEKFEARAQYLTRKPENTERSETRPPRADRPPLRIDRPDNVRTDRSPSARDERSLRSDRSADRGAPFAPRGDRTDKRPDKRAGKSERPSDQLSPRFYRPDRGEPLPPRADLRALRNGTPPSRSEPPAARKGKPTASSAQIFVGLGRRAGIRPADLVGALINEVGLERAQVGAVAIEEAHTLVEVPSSRAKDVVDALREMHIRGRKVFARIQNDAGTKRP